MRNKLISLLILLFLPVLLFAQQTQNTPKGVDDDVAKEVAKQILKQKKVKIDNFKVLHNGDTIYLEGVADNFGSRYVAGVQAAKAKGIKNVDNQIAVTAHENVTDNEIQAEMVRIVNSQLRGTPFDLIGVEVNHGFVRLTGTVRDQTLPDKIMKDAVWVNGVRGIDNQIQLASISAGDERLRQTIFNILNRQYPQYFVGKQPSIIIVVDGGRVLLSGYVNTDAEKQRISSTVRSINGVLSLNNQLQTS
jgi:osmotically-inducible protein OsmY